jgi:5-methylcytosine-specific restriction protein A
MQHRVALYLERLGKVLMAWAAPRICARCGGLAQQGQPCACRPAFEGSNHPGNSRRWARCRRSQLKAQPICGWPGCRLLATEVDHVVPLAEGGSRWSSSNWQSLCGGHHAQKSTLDAQRGKTRPR